MCVISCECGNRSFYEWVKKRRTWLVKFVFLLQLTHVDAQCVMRYFEKQL